MSVFGDKSSEGHQMWEMFSALEGGGRHADAMRARAELRKDGGRLVYL